MKALLIGVAALFYGAFRAIFVREKTPEEWVKDRDDMRHDARWP